MTYLRELEELRLCMATGSTDIGASLDTANNRIPIWDDAADEIKYVNPVDIGGGGASLPSPGTNNEPLLSDGAGGAKLNGGWTWDGSDLTVSGDVNFAGNFRFTASDTTSPALQNTTAGLDTSFRIMPADRDGTDSVGFNLDVVGTKGDANRETFSCSYQKAPFLYYSMFQFTSGTGTAKPFHIYAKALGQLSLLPTGGSTGFVGIGTATPARNMHVHEATASTANTIQVTNAASGSTSTDGMLFGLSSGNEAQFWIFENIPFKIATNSTERLRVASTGEFLLGTTTSPSANAGPSQLIFGDTGTQFTSGSNTCGLCGDDVAGTVELFALDEASNSTQLTSHPPDAPSEMLSDFSYIPLIHKTIRYQLGEVHWIHGEKNDPTVPTDRWRIIESFADYNARTGENLVQMDVAAENARRQATFQTEYDRVKLDQAKWFHMPRSQRGEFPQLPPAAKPVP